ncbi:helix-turn-helix domain-containing protein [Pinirhizobacter soli]|uniref:helix-turn-helix domain-containing protein n=1 Tax=Pinirhizobacter soli TaxID=2786953 RepID=UPI00202A25DE|nr:helix-turn-helix transcriptional regulator [Pinirhizobacter soli]
MKQTSIYSERHQIAVDYLRELRVVQKLTQADVAEALGRPQTYVSDVEVGKRRLELLSVVSYCAALGVPFPAFAKELARRLNI